MQKLLYMILCLSVVSFKIQKKKTNQMSAIYFIAALIGYMIHVMNDTPHKRESFTQSSLTETDTFIDVLFNEPILNNNDHPLRRNLVLYVSSFNKSMLNFGSEQNTMTNIINKNLGAITSEKLKVGFHQIHGVNIEKTILLQTPKELFTDGLKFSIVVNMRIGTIPSDSNGMSLFKFDADNTEAFKLFDIKFYNVNKKNPDIKVFWGGQQCVHYTYDDSHMNEGKLFNDYENHTFIIVKDDKQTLSETGQNESMFGNIHIFMDGILIASGGVPSIQLRANDADVQLSGEKHYTTLNTGHGTNQMHFNLAAFAIYDNRALTAVECIDWTEYINSVHIRLNPECKILYSERLEEKLKHLDGTTCKVNDELICSEKCTTVENWNNLESLTKNRDCFKAIVTYCDNTSNQNDKDFCSFLNRQGIFESASILDSNLLYYRHGSENKESLTNHEILEDLQKLGLKDVFIDKSFRSEKATGYSAEMRKLLRDLLETNQTVNLETMDKIKSSIQNEKNDDEIDNLLSKLKASDETTPSSSKQADKLHGSDLIDLDITNASRSDSYKHIIDQYNVDKNRTSDTGMFGKMMSWFT